MPCGFGWIISKAYLNHTANRSLPVIDLRSPRRRSPQLCRFSPSPPSVSGPGPVLSYVLDSTCNDALDKRCNLFFVERIRHKGLSLVRVYRIEEINRITGFHGISSLVGIGYPVSNYVIGVKFVAVRCARFVAAVFYLLYHLEVSTVREARPYQSSVDPFDPRPALHCKQSNTFNRLS
ncbi:hypothetical protein J6590_021659 [Homalodisca vitripennis]|nr:hypothetical protein J6590_021659 [Homalodisca vitripennis]